MFFTAGIIFENKSKASKPCLTNSLTMFPLTQLMQNKTNDLFLYEPQQWNDMG